MRRSDNLPVGGGGPSGLDGSPSGSAAADSAATTECNGPRDCIGTEQGCDHCGIAEPAPTLLDLLREEYDALGMVSYTGDGNGGWIPDLRAQDIEGIMRLLMAAGAEFGRLIVADRAASVAHDFIHGLNGVTKEQADEAIWAIHNHLRPLFEEEAE